MLNPLVGQTSAQAIPADQLKLMRVALYIAGPLVDYKDKGYSAELAGREDVAGQSNYKVHLFDNAGTDVVYYFNPQTYLISQTVTKAKVTGKPDVTNTAAFSDYRKTDIGYTMAYTVASTNMGYDITITYTAVEFNKDVDPKIFEMPDGN